MSKEMHLCQSMNKLMRIINSKGYRSFKLYFLHIYSKGIITYDDYEDIIYIHDKLNEIKHLCKPATLNDSDLALVDYLIEIANEN